MTAPVPEKGRNRVVKALGVALLLVLAVGFASGEPLIWLGVVIVSAALIMAGAGLLFLPPEQ